MSDNYNNQQDNRDCKPDYSYNWNGSEYNGNRRGGGRGFIIAAIVAALVVALICVGVIIANNALPGESESEGQSSSGLQTSTESKTNVSVPVFKPADNAYDEHTTNLTEVYEKASASCCTIYVTYRNTTGYSIGSGFVIDAENGYIATNHHVIENADNIKAIFYDGKEYEAKLVGSDSVTDLAVLRISATGLTAVTFGVSDNLKIGEYVVAIGTPYSQSLSGTMTCGIISGIARDIKVTNSSGKVIKTMTLIQTDCSINPGNSGGPLIDMSGNVVGITSMKIVNEEFEGIGFAIPITQATEIFGKLIAGEEIVDSGIATATAKLGITVYRLEDGLQFFGMNPKCEYPTGVLVSNIERKSSVYAAGLSLYDIITEFNGDKIESLDDLTNSLAKCKAGQTVTMKIFHFNRALTSGEYMDITFKLDPAT